MSTIMRKAEIESAMRSRAVHGGGWGLSPWLVVMICFLICGAVTAGFFLGRGTRSRHDSSEAQESGFIVTVNLNETLNFGDALRVTLTEIANDPPTRRVTARVLLNGEPEMQILKAEEGYAVTYPKEHGYTIKVLKIEPDLAKFSIVKKP